MYFDPLTSWIVVLLANGVSLAGEHVSDAEVTQYYKNKVKESNHMLNSQLRHRLTQKYYLVDSEIQHTVWLLDYYKKKFEYRYGVVELEPDVQQLIINLYKECIDKHTESLRGYEKCRGTSRTAEHATYIEKCIATEKTKIVSCQQVIEAVEEERRRKQREAEERQKAIENESPVAGFLGLLFLLFLVIVVICFFFDI